MLLPLLPLTINLRTTFLKSRKNGQKSELYYKLANVARSYGECIKSLLDKLKPYSAIGEKYPYSLHERVSLRIQSECGKRRTRITPNTDTFHAVQFS